MSDTLSRWRDAKELFEALENLVSEIAVMRIIANRGGNPGLFDGLEPELQAAEDAMKKWLNEGRE